MFKSICLIVLISLAYTQDASSLAGAVSSAVGNDVNSAVNNAVNNAASASVSSVVNNVSSVVGSVDPNSLPALNNVTVGYGSREVILTPQSADVNNNDWLNNNESINIDRVSSNAADGEWAFSWSVENGDDYALLNQNGDLVIIDWDSGVENNLGQQAALDANIASGAEQLVDAAYESEASVIGSAQVGDYIKNILSNNNLNGFLSNQVQSGANLAQGGEAAVQAVGGDAQAALNGAQAALNGAQ